MGSNVLVPLDSFWRDDSQDFSVYGMGPTTVPLSIDLMTHWAKESSNRCGSTRYRNRPMCCKSRYPCPHNESLTRRSPRLNAAFSRGAVYIVLFFGSLKLAYLVVRQQSIKTGRIVVLSF